MSICVDESNIETIDSHVDNGHAIFVRRSLDENEQNINPTIRENLTQRVTRKKSSERGCREKAARLRLNSLTPGNLVGASFRSQQPCS